MGIVGTSGRGIDRLPIGQLPWGPTGNKDAWFRPQLQTWKG